MFGYLIYVLLRLLDVYSFLLIAYALLSWFPGASSSGIGRWLENIVFPVITPLRRLNLQFAGLDFTILVALFLLNFLGRLLIMVLV